MWKTSVLLLATLSVCGCAGLTTQTRDQWSVQQVIETPGLSGSQLFDRSQRWVAGSFKPLRAGIDEYVNRSYPSGVITYANRTEGILIGNGSIFYPTQGLGTSYREEWEVRFVFSIETKDARARITFDRLSIFQPKTYVGPYYSWRGSQERPLVRQSEQNEIKPALLALAADLQRQLSSPQHGEEW